MSGIGKALFGGSDSSSKQTQALDPRFANAYFGLQGTAQQTAKNLGVQQFAGFTGDQQFANNQTRAMAAGWDPGAAYRNAGAQQLMEAGSYQPLMAGASGAPTYTMNAASAGPAALAQGGQIDRAGIQNVQGGSAAAGMGAYMDPYTGQVIDAAMGDLERQRQIVQTDNRANAAAAKALGNDRRWLVEAETNRGFADKAAQTAATLRSAGFQQAAANAQQDATRGLQAGMANQGVDAQTAYQNAQLMQQLGITNAGAINAGNQFNANLGQQANQFNAGALNQGAQFNAGQDLQASLANQQAGLTAQQLGLTAGGQLAGLGQQQYQNMQSAIQGLNTFGAQQQGLAQQRLDAQRNLETERLQILMNALGINPGGGGGMTSTGTSSGDQRNGLFSILGG